MITLTLRRYYIDDLLNAHKPLMRGKVLDIGGKKDNKRGFFRPPVADVKSWEYLNIDKNTAPDYLCAVSNMPFENSSFDTVIFCEILEHLAEPEKALLEIARILKPGGNLIMSVPFLYAIHGDPDDYQRWTEPKIKSELSQAGFCGILIKPLGGVFAVIFDLLHSAMKSGLNLNNFFVRIFYRGFYVFVPVFKCLDRIFLSSKSIITTGYFAVARK